jgi:hypothetical protein
MPQKILHVFEDITAFEILELIEKYQNQEKIITLHPNGFLQLGLTDSIDKRSNKFQLHVWDKEIKRRGPEIFQVHDHAFEIKSYVVIGSLINETYKIQQDSQGSYQIFRGDGTGQLSATGERVSCILEKTEVIQKGNEYIIPKGEFHASKTNNEITATIIVKKEIDKEYKSKVIAPMDYLENRIEIDRTIDQTLAWSIVDKIKEEIRKDII